LAKVAVQYSADCFVVKVNLYYASKLFIKIATFAKPETVSGHANDTTCKFSEIYRWTIIL
jgi:hypothetical protein